MKLISIEFNFIVQRGKGKGKILIIMSPGVNDGSRKTGTLPKSNRRNGDIHEVNNPSSLRSIYNGRLPQHPNNLVLLIHLFIFNQLVIKLIKLKIAHL